MTHPTGHELATLADGSLSVQDAARVQTHLSSCPECTSTFEAMRTVVKKLGTTPEFRPDFDAIRPRPTAFARLFPVVMGVGVAAAAAVVMTRAPAMDLTARGGAQPPAWRISVEQDGMRAELSSGAHLKTAPLVASASMTSHEQGRRFIGAYLVDAQRGVHWIWPFWNDAQNPPRLVPLDGPGVASSDRVKFEAPPGGALQACLVSSDTACSVKDLDDAIAGSRTLPCNASAECLTTTVDGVGP